MNKLLKVLIFILWIPFICWMMNLLPSTSIGYIIGYYIFLFKFLVFPVGGLLLFWAVVPTLDKK